MVFIKGFILILSLIVAIGAQNMFVIKQAILKNHIILICSICFICDAILLACGVFGVGKVLLKNETMSLIVTILGMLFLITYAMISLKSAFMNTNCDFQNDNEKLSVKKAITLTLAITLLNPHVYLDTIFLVGANAINIQQNERILFFLGGVCASFLWFFSLGLGVSKISKILLNKKIYFFIEILTSLIMIYIAYDLLKILIN
ncbi:MULTISPECIES: LysE/ArgO family amino acid transporter [unclassified Campylobacter]|uniref:LysE/ArgO family amino acid transporter n=1 Tax=unclassified Campylobacter TaxID=2593542 RepID=UPI001D78952D|nr:LysE family transporter [Campylobacter sp. RM12651]MBZ7991704.1 LysE family transporter [Campylobacter sp. RM9331]MBZ8006178.1 LysE family transporter [Campylobacter sp. RM9332]ULO03872.1 transporter, LysE family [Campylobacter sp. RM12651]